MAGRSSSLGGVNSGKPHLSARLQRGRYGAPIIMCPLDPRLIQKCARFWRDFVGFFYPRRTWKSVVHDNLNSSHPYLLRGVARAMLNSEFVQVADFTRLVAGASCSLSPAAGSRRYGIEPALTARGGSHILPPRLTRQRGPRPRSARRSVELSINGWVCTGCRRGSAAGSADQRTRTAAWKRPDASNQPAIGDSTRTTSPRLANRSRIRLESFAPLGPRLSGSFFCALVRLMLVTRRVSEGGRRAASLTRRVLMRSAFALLSVSNGRTKSGRGCQRQAVQID
jgi:hypothetical protein